MEITIHIYHHILTGDMAALEAEIADLKARIPTPEDLTALDDMMSKANELATIVDTAIAEYDALR